MCTSRPHKVADTFTLGGLEITPLPVPHGTVSTYGYLFCRGGRKLLAYISDVAWKFRNRCGSKVENTWRS